MKLLSLRISQSEAPKRPQGREGRRGQTWVFVGTECLRSLARPVVRLFLMSSLELYGVPPPSLAQVLQLARRQESLAQLIAHGVVRVT